MKKIIVIILVSLLTIPTLSWFIGVKNLSTDIDENRKLKDFPKLTNTFFANFEDYFLDHAPYRSNNIKANLAVNNALTVPYKTILDTLNVSYYFSKNNVLMGQNDWLFYLGDDSISFYQGTNLLTADELQSYTEKMDKINNYFQSINKTIIFVVAPNKEQVYAEYMPSSIKIQNTPKRLDLLNDYIKHHSQVKFVYLFDEMLSHKEQCQLYYKYDTHWNYAGGYYGVNAILKELNLKQQDAQLILNPQATGDLKKMLGEPYEIDSDYKISFNENYNPITTESATEQKVTLSTNPNNLNCLIIGDSFRNLMMPTLSNAFTYTKSSHRDNFYNGTITHDDFDKANVIIIEAVERYSDQLLLDELITYFNIN